MQYYVFMHLVLLICTQAKLTLFSFQVLILTIVSLINRLLIKDVKTVLQQNELRLGINHVSD